MKSSMQQEATKAFDLFQLSLNIGQSLDIKIICSTFVKSLTDYSHVKSAAFWLKSECFIEGEDLSTHLFVQVTKKNPRKKIQIELPPSHPLLLKIKSSKNLLFSSDDILLKDLSLNKKESGEVAIFSLGEEGFLVIQLKSLWNSEEFQQFKYLIPKLSQALDHCINYQQLVQQVTNHKKTEKALQARIKFEDLITEISTHFINLAPEEIDEGINHALHKIGAFAKVDRSYVFLFASNGFAVNNTHEWCEKGIQPHIDSLKDFSLNAFSWFKKKVKQKQIIHVPSLTELPEEALVEKAEFEKDGIQSFIVVPMTSGRKAIGFLGFDSVKEEKSWSKESISLLKIVGEIFVNALERKRVQEALLESEERYALAAQGANDGLWDWNVKTNEVYFSPRWKKMLKIIGKDKEMEPHIDEWLTRVHPRDIEQLKGDLNDHLDGKTPHFENEHRMKAEDGSYRWMLSRGMLIRDLHGNPSRVAGSQTDITKRKKAESQLLFEILHDSLTSLPNRVLLMEYLEQAITKTETDKDYSFAVLLIDLDRFKMVNNGLGHRLGDQLIIEVGKRLKESLRKKDVLARVGGDEFCLLLHDVNNISQAEDIAEHVLEVFEKPFYLEGNEVFASTSIGLVLNAKENETPEHLMRDADTAMHRAKAKGKSCYVAFDPMMHDRAVLLLNLENDLRRAVEREEFKIEYQPIVSLEKGGIVGFEALVRWNRPDRDSALQNEFIPVAEETGLIVPIGQWVLREACIQMAKWQKKYEQDLEISVNISGRQFARDDLVEQVLKILKESKLNAKSLKLEITESALMENSDSATAILHRLKQSDIQLHVDDFGTGYSSLSYLHRFPIDTLKIDRSFVSQLDKNGENIEIVRTIINLARNLNMKVVGEGVETAHQLSILRKLNCKFGQGYFFSTPVDGKTAEQLIASQPRW